jgi:hypothetical protein
MIEKTAILNLDARYEMTYARLDHYDPIERCEGTVQRLSRIHIRSPRLLESHTSTGHGCRKLLLCCSGGNHAIFTSC